MMADLTGSYGSLQMPGIMKKYLNHILPVWEKINIYAFGTIIKSKHPRVGAICI